MKNTREKRILVIHWRYVPGWQDVYLEERHNFLLFKAWLPKQMVTGEKPYVAAQISIWLKKYNLSSLNIVERCQQ